MKGINFNPIEWAGRFRVAYLKRPNFIQNPLIWCFRQASLPWFILPIYVYHKNGSCYYLSKDSVDDKVLWGIYKQFSDLYFPQSLDVPRNVWFLDIGAHHGFYTISALYHYPDIKVISVEPDPVSIKLLRRNIRINQVESRVEVIHAALGKNVGKGWLTQAGDGSWGNYMGKYSDSGIEVPVTKIGDVLGARIPFLVKCNSEGGEFEIVPAMFELDVFPEIILLFVHPERGDERKLLQSVRSQGYEVVPVHSSMEHPRYICRRSIKE